jgi:hypothetical protein
VQGLTECAPCAVVQMAQVLYHQEHNTLHDGVLQSSLMPVIPQVHQLPQYGISPAAEATQDMYPAQLGFHAESLHDQLTVMQMPHRAPLLLPHTNGHHRMAV